MEKDINSFPGVANGGRRLPLRFTIPTINFGDDTLAIYEAGCGVPYLSILDAVLMADGVINDKDDIAGRVKQKVTCKKAQSTAQGMLFYLHNLFTHRNKAQAIEPPINTSMVVWWRKRYEFFDEVVNEFEHELCDAAEDELYTRAVLGTDAPVVINGDIQYINKKSDDLLKFYLTHNRPKRYSQKSEVKSTVEANVNADIKAQVKLDRSSFAHLSDEELEGLEALLLKGSGA